MHVDLLAFIVASFVGRGMRFFAVSYVSDRYGLRAKKIIMENQKRSAMITYALIIGLVLYMVLKSKGIL